MKGREVTVREPGWLKALHDRIHGAIDRWFGHGPARMPEPTQPQPLPAFLGGSAFGPAVDVIVEPDAIRVVAELPGLTPEDFRVEVAPGQLILRGEKKASRQEVRDGTVYSECTYGSFSRVIPLPAEVRTEGAEASCANGVLELRLPRTAGARARTVDVKIR